jgi:predicted phage terminase large subunit-like protein
MEKLAVRDNMKCRRLIQSRWYQRLWPVHLVGDQNSKLKFENNATGFREAMAFTSMTGSRGDRVILDDPHSVDDANSAVKLENDVLTFREALPSRVNNDRSAIVIIMQRLHERDISAVASDLGYDHLIIPMRYETNRPGLTWRGEKREGELMFPARFSEKAVDELERTLGAYATAGQLQQRPAPRDGGLFKPSWFTPISVMPAGITRTVRAWDMAATAKSTSNNPDWTAGVIMSRCADGTFLIHGCRRFQGSPMEVETSIINQAPVDGQRVTIRLAQDPGQAGKAQAEMMVRKLAGYSVKVERPTGDKATRAAPLASQAEAGNVRILVTGDMDRDAWVQPFLDELAMFPAGAKDDQVDAAADAFSELALGASLYSINALAS